MEETEERHYWQPAVSLAMLAGGLILSYTDIEWFADGMPRLIWYAAAFLPVGFGVMREAAEHAARGNVFSEFMLMSVASLGAFAIGEYPEAVAVMLFYCIGEMLQDAAVDRARDNIRSLVACRPDRAVVVDGERLTAVSPEAVSIGDIIEVKAGERVALDGTLVSGDATFDTAALTGESMPRLIDRGGEVLAGMIAAGGVARIRVTRKATDSAMARITAMVEEAAGRKAPAELFIRRFARIYTPAVTLLAALTVAVPWFLATVSGDFAFNPSTWIYRALIFLVISCPCALVVSIPLSYFAGIGAASRRGILFKGGNCLDMIRGVDTVVFDKTGTLTTGRFKVLEIDESGRNDMLAVVAAMEKGSNHPIARAITDRAERVAEGVTDIKETAGYGLSARRGTDRWLAGTTRLLKREGVAYPPELDTAAYTLVACALNGSYAGSILLGDDFKSDAAETVNRLREAGIKHIEILSGDRPEAVNRAVSCLKADGGRGDLMPEDKLRRVEQLKRDGRTVAFVGDGINDAPVIAAADAGIAMGAAGSDMAVETADIVIQADSTVKVAEAVMIGSRTRNIVVQNIVFSISVKLAVMALGAAGLANMWGAVFADVGTALIAVVNACRIFFGNSGRR